MFSLWEAIAATAGNIPLTRGGFCKVSGTVADGSAGAGYYTYYDWKPKHTYQFTVSALGNYQFRSTVKDITPGITNPDSFDIGTITVDSKAIPPAKNAIPLIGGGNVSQWTEYFDWNSNRTTCQSVPYTKAVFTMAATDSISGVTKAVIPALAPRNNSYNNVTSVANCASATITGGIGASTQ